MTACGELAVVALAVVVAAVDLDLGVARSRTDLPRLGSNSCPLCSPCQVGAERRVPDATAHQKAECVASFADIWSLWEALEGTRRFPAGETDQGCPRLALATGANGKRTPGAAAAANAAGGSLPVRDTRAPEGRFSVPTVACLGRSSEPWVPRPCVL